MESLNQFFAYDNDYSNIDSIFSNLFEQLKVIHEHNMYVPNLSGDTIVLDDDNCFSYSDMLQSDNIELDKRKNMVSLAKIMLGAYLSLETGYKDFSYVPDDWFTDNIESICSSISSDNFHPDYFTSLFANGSNEYYSDYLERVKQNESLNNKSNVQTYKKVLANAASSLYQDQTFDEEDLSVEKKSASINVIFYPLLIGCLLIVSVSIAILIKMSN